MKKILFILFTPVFLLFACDEIAPVISPQVPVGSDVCELEVDVANQERNVIIEEFTGVRCINCPSGAEEIENIIAEIGDRVKPVALHAGEFSPPYPESLYDFRTTDGTGLFNFIGPAFAYPASAVNRVAHNPSNNIIPVIGKDNWQPLVISELAKPLTIKLGIAHIYKADSMKLDICAKVFPQIDITDEDVRVTVMITENDIIDYQSTEQGKKSDYKHKHVMREIVSAAEGNLITEAMTAGAEISLAFTTTIPADWNVDNCEIVVMVHKGGDAKDVFQVETAHLVE
ncbi:MAG: hypothetical protein ACI9XO_000101 [Paraglaciecola sp.]|jgi:hypothetical protein